MESPVKQIRQAFGLTQLELAAISGLSSSSSICEIEKGLRPISDRLSEVLRNAHVDVDQVKKQHEAFMAERRRAIESRLQHLSETGRR